LRPDTVLAFDTSAAHCAAVLLSGDQLWHRSEPMEKGQAERLVPMLEVLLAEAGLTWADLTLLGVGTGPGNFTGVRIAVAAARGLALGLGIPSIGITTFGALSLGQNGPTLVAQDARRGAAYVQMFNPDGRADIVNAGDLPDALTVTADMQVMGDLADIYASRYGFSVATPLFPLAEAIARKALLVGGTRTERAAPFYLRGADAAPPSDPPPVIVP